MNARTGLLFSLSACALLTAAPVQAQQRSNFGQQLQQQLLNNVENRVLGQPNGYPNQTAYPYGNPGYYPNGNPGYYPNQPGNRYPYQVQRPTYGPNGYQPASGYSQPGYPSNGMMGQPTPRYQLPAQYSGYAPGSTLTYAGRPYVVNPDRTISPIDASRPMPAFQRYQIPAQFAGAAPGSTITYGAAQYSINNDGTMSPLAGQ